MDATRLPAPEPDPGDERQQAEADETATLARQLAERGEPDQAQALLTSALKRVRSSPRATLMLAQAQLGVHRGQFLEALGAAVEAGELFRSAGHRPGVCDALVMSATTLRAAGDHASALTTLEEAEGLAREIGDELRLGRVMRQIGVVSSLLGRHQHAHACLEEATGLLEHHAPADERRACRQSALNVFSRYLMSQDPAERSPAATQSHLEDWLALAGEAQAGGQTRVALMCWGNHAIQLHVAGRPAEAVAALRDLVPRYRECGMQPNEALAHVEAGIALEALADVAAARDHYLQGRSLLDATSAPDDLLQCLEGLARCEEALGDPAAALAALKALRALEARRRDDAARQALLQRELRIELARLTSQWARQATQDSLTGLANRRAFERWLADHWPRVEQGHTLAVVLVDLDHFKQINDRFGHPLGDEVLKTVARVLQQHSRGTDLAVRYGGEEFLLALGDTGLPQAATLAERVRDALAAEPWIALAPTLRVTASFGVADAGEVLSPEALLALADRRLYAAKYGGRDRIVAVG
jgi:diguanylate cyclase (GGDEF)-like protein